MGDGGATGKAQLPTADKRVQQTISDGAELRRPQDGTKNTKC